jgi:hypothetical protein
MHQVVDMVSPRPKRSEAITASKSALEHRLMILRNERSVLLAEIQGLGNGTAERVAALASKRRRLRALDRQIALAEVALLDA